MVLIVRNDGVGVVPPLLEKQPEVLNVTGYAWTVAVIVFGKSRGDRELGRRLALHVEVDALREYDLDACAVYVSYAHVGDNESARPEAWDGLAGRWVEREGVTA